MGADATDDATPFDALTYSWNFGDGGTSSEAFPSHPYAIAGYYVVKVTVSDGDGGQSFASFMQAVGQPALRPLAFFDTDYDNSPVGINNGSVRPGTAVKFYDQSSTDDDGTPLTGFSWDWGDGTPNDNSNNPTPTHTFTNPGHYTVVETVTDQNGHQDRFAETINVSAATLPPEVSIGFAPQGPRIDQTVEFSRRSSTRTTRRSGASRVRTSTTTGTSATDAHSSAAEPSHTYTTGGSKLVTLTVTDTTTVSRARRPR